MTNPLTPEERAELMRKAGIPEDVIATSEPATVMPTIHEEAELGDALTSALASSEPEHFTTAPVVEVTSTVAVNTMAVDDLDAIAAALIERSKGDKDKALAACDAHVQAWFDERKLSTKQAAAKGIERSEHNKPLWQAAQDMRSKLKARVRQHHANSGGFVKRKAAAHVPKSAAEQFLATQGVSDPAVVAFLTQFTQFINQHKEDK